MATIVFIAKSNKIVLRDFKSRRAENTYCLSLSKDYFLNKQTKQAAGGIGVAGIIVSLIHIAHGIFAISEPSVKPEDAFKNAAVTIILTDSITGKKDTLDMSTYLKEQEKKSQSK